MTFANWLKTCLAELDDVPDDIAGDHLAVVIDEAAKRAAACGLPAAVEACQIRPGPVGIDLARRVLSACRGACQSPAMSSALTVAQVAERLNVAPDTVTGWIHSGALKGSNVGKGLQRGRYRVAPADLDAFIASRQPEPPATRRQRVTGFKRY
jgi:excisionase family DNA binding protein